MNCSLYSLYINSLCYIVPDNKLFISHVENNIFNHTEIIIDSDIIASTIRVDLISNFIVLHTNTDDVYIYDISANKLKYLEKYFITSVFWCGTIFKIFTTFITNNGIVTFDENFIKIFEYILPTNEILEKISIFESGQNYFVCTSEKTYILNMDLVVITCIDAKYISIAQNNNFYYCATDNGNVHICDEYWKFILCIDNLKITINYHLWILMAYFIICVAAAQTIKIVTHFCSTVKIITLSNIRLMEKIICCVSLCFIIAYIPIQTHVDVRISYVLPYLINM